MERAKLSQKYEIDSKGFNECNTCDRIFDTCQSWAHLVNEVALRIRQTLELSTILQTTVDEVHRLLKCDRVLVYQFDPDWRGRVVTEAISDPQWSVVDRVVHDSCFESSWIEPYQEKRYFAIEDIAKANLTPCHAEFLASFQVQANLVIPILKEDTLWGLLIAHHCQAPRRWQAVEIEALQLLAVQVGIAIHQAALIDQLQTAKSTLEVQVAARTQELAQANQALQEANQKLVAKIQERNQVAAEVIQREAFLQQVLDSLFVFVGVMTPDGILIEANQAPLELAGLTRDDVIGKPFVDAYWWAYSPEAQAAIRSAIETANQGSMARFDIPAQMQGGKLATIDFALTPLRNPRTGQITHLIPSGVDISDRIQAEAERLQAQAQLKQLGTIVASSHVAIISKTPDGIVTSWNKAAEATFGYTAEEMIGQSITTIIPPEKRDEAIGILEKIRQGQQVKTYETQRRHQNGQLLDVSLTISPIYDESGQVVGASKIARDITAQKRDERLRQQAENALRASQDRFQRFMENAPLLSWIVSREGRVEYGNEAWFTFVGQSETAALGQVIEDLFPPEFAQAYREANQQVLQSGQVVETFEKAIAPDGSLHTFLVRKFPVYTKSQMTSVGGIGIDITKQQQAEALIRDQAETLRIFYETSPLMMGLVEISDNDILHLSDNPAALSFFGLTAQELANHWASQVGVPAEVIQRWLTHYRQSQQQQRPVQFDYTHITPTNQHHLLVAVSFVGISDNDRPRFSYIVQDLTEKKQLECEKDKAITRLHDSEQRYANLVAAVPVGIFRADAVGQCTYTNERWEAMTGISRKRALGNGWLESIHPDDREQVFSAWLTAAQTQQRFELEYRLQSTTGQVVWVYGQAVAEYTAAGELLGYVGTLTDITEQKQIESERQRAQQTEQELSLLEQILDIVLAGYWDWHIATNVEYYSPGFKQMLGYEDHELPNAPQTWQDLIFPDDLPGALEQFNRHVQSRGAEPYYTEVRYRHKDGSTVWILCSGQVIDWDDEGNALRMIGCHIDITWRKQAEDALRQSEATNRALIQSIPDFLVRMRQDGVQLDVINTGNVHCLWPEDEEPIQGHSVLDIMPTDIGQERIHLAQMAIATGTSQKQEYSFTQDGQTYYEEARISPISGNEVLVMVRDISDRKQAESELKTTKEQLELVLKASSEGFWDWNLITNDIYFSPRWKEMLGYTDQELDNTFEMWGSVIFEEDRIAALQLVEDYNSGKVDNFTMVQRFRHKNGSTVFILSRAIHLKDAEGLVVRMVGSHLDMTDNKRQELALQESEARYRNIIETTLEGVWMLDAEGKTTFVNQRMAEMLGYDIAAMQHQSFLNFIASEDQEQAQTYFARRREGIQEQHSFKFCRQDGSELWTMLSGTPLLDQNGAYQGAIGLLTDITPLVNTQEALKNSELQLSGILNSSLDGIMAFRSIRNDQGQIIDFEWLLSNPTACQIVNKSMEDLVGHRLLDVLPGNRTDGLFDQYVRVVETGEPIQRQFHYAHDGIDTWFENVAVKLGDGFTVTFRDISGLKTSEQALHKANQNLETHLNDLRQRNQEMLLLSETSDFLQACRTIEEACSVITSLVEPLFPSFSGSFHITCASRNRIEAVAQWGDLSVSQKEFQPHDCWALRRGKWHQTTPDSLGLRCQHITTTNPQLATLCIPMIAQGETLGMFHLSTEDFTLLNEAKRQLARTVAEQVGLAIANLHLRETLQSQSIRDSLTGLFNRRYLEESLQKEIARAQRNQSSVAVVMVDVDHFKAVNDTFGHDVGDVALQAISQVLKNTIRESDTACRYGGEEMTLVLPDVSLSDAIALAEKLRQSIQQLTVNYGNQRLSDLSASFGVAVFPQHGTVVAGLIRAADAALYRAKTTGRNKVVAASSELGRE